MDEHYRLAAVELGIEFVFVRMAEITMPGVGLQIDAVELECIESVVNVAACCRNVWQRDEGHGAKFSRMVADHLRHRVIASANQRLGELDIACLLYTSD